MVSRGGGGTGGGGGGWGNGRYYWLYQYRYLIAGGAGSMGTFYIWNLEVVEVCENSCRPKWNMLW